jgi:type I restriction enzyme S subunit
MAGEWEEKALRELFDVKHGFAFKGKHFVEEPTDFIVTTPGNFTIGGGFQNNKPKYYNGPIPDGYVLAPGDVIVTMTDLSKASDTLGNAALVPDDGNTWLHNQRIGLLEFPNRQAADQKFTCYLLRSNEYRSWIIGSATGTTVKHTSPSRITEFSCALPPLPEQKAIAHVLGSLDDKIELNRRMNETLEGMAQAMFKSWFVDFDPVIDNALAAGNPIPEPLAQRAETRRQAIANGTANRETAQAFPASFRFTEELGWIPEGWEVQALELQIEFIVDNRGKTPPTSDYIAGNFPLVEVNAIRGKDRFADLGQIKKYVDSTTYKSWFRKGHPKEYDVLLSTVGSIGEISMVGNEAYCIAQNVVSLRSKNSGLYLYELLKHHKRELINLNISSVQPSIKIPHLMGMPVISEHGAEQLFHSKVSAFNSKIESGRKENRTLEKLRNVLLPKLISGELRIPQAEKMVEDAIA